MKFTICDTDCIEEAAFAKHAMDGVAYDASNTRALTRKAANS